MKTMKFTAPSTAMAILTALAFTPSSTLASGENVGDTQRCIHLSLIDDSPAIDDRTILVEMRGSGGYKRIDLVGSCSGLIYNGFTFSTPIGKLCTNNTLSVLQPGGAVCAIDKIVTIDKAEAKTLRARR